MNATSNPIFRFAFGMVALLSWHANVGLSQEATVTIEIHAAASVGKTTALASAGFDPL